MNHYIKYAILLILIPPSITACARKLEIEKSSAIPRMSPLKVAVLPFAVEKEEMQEGADLIRKLFTANLKESSLEIIEISVVDSILKKHNLFDQNKIEQTITQNPRKFGEIFGANAVIRGKIHKWQRIYALVESSVETEAWVKMTDTFSGNTIISVRKGEIRNAGITRIPTGYVAAAISPVTGMQKLYLYQLSNELSRNLAQPFIDSFQTDISKPLIITACAVLKKNEPFADSLYLVLIGDSGKHAYFSIGDSGKIPMTETSKGCYHGYIEGSFGNNDKAVFTLSRNNIESNYTAKISVSD